MHKASKPVTVFLSGGNLGAHKEIAEVIIQSNRLHILGCSTSGIETIDQHDKIRPDIILVDVTTDDISGFETGRSIKEQIRERKVVILSTRYEQSFHDLTLELGLDGYLFGIPDPLTIDLLLKELSKGKIFFRNRPGRPTC